MEEEAISRKALRAIKKDDATALRRCLNRMPTVIREKIRGKYLLHYAVQASASRSVHALAKFGADMSCVSSCGWTPLHQAAAAGNLEMLDLLAILGAELDKRDHEGLTALQIGSHNRNGSVVKFLQVSSARNLSGRMQRHETWQAKSYSNRDSGNCRCN